SSLAVTGCCDNTARLWEVPTGRPVCAPMRHLAEPEWVGFSPDGRYVLTSNYDYTVRLWDIASATPVRLRIPHDIAYGASFSSDNRLLAATSIAGRVLLWDVATGAVKGAPLVHPSTRLLDAQFSPDGRFMVTRARVGESGYRDAWIWDLATRKI